MQGFFKQEMNNIKQILFCTDPQVSVGIIVDDADVSAGDDGRKIVKAGTPMYGSLLDRATPFTVTGSDTDPSVVTEIGNSSTPQAVGITAATVTASTFATKVNNVGGSYAVTYKSPSIGTSDGWDFWALGTSDAPIATDITLSDYGIVVTGTPEADDYVEITLTAGVDDKAQGVLLHDVDVTAGDNNGTLLIFGFVNANRIDTETQTALFAAASDLEGKVYICAG